MKTTILIGFSLLISCSHAALSSSWRGEVHGHRGARARFPENTIPSFEYALQTGVDVLEMDLAVTKDRVLVLSHDPYVNPDICDGPNAARKPLIFGMTLVQLKHYDCGAKRNPRFPDQKPLPGTQIPTLDEVLSRFAPEKIRFNIETKIRPDRPGETTTPEEFVDLLLKALDKHRLRSRTVIQSFDFRTLAEAKRRDPDLILAALVEGPFKDLVKIAQETGVQFISPNFNLVDAKVVQNLHAMDVKIVPWTANEESVWKKLIAAKVDGIITDDPEKLLHFLNRGAKNSGK